MLVSLRYRLDTSERLRLLRDAYLMGYERVHPLPVGFPGLLFALMAFRELVVMRFILESDNAKVHTWRQGRVQMAIHHLESSSLASRSPR